MNIDRLVNIVVSSYWILLAVGVVLYRVQRARQVGVRAALAGLFSIRGILIPLLIGIMLSLISSSLIFIEPSYRGVVVSGWAAEGIRDRPLRGGVHWIIPLIERVYYYPIFWQTYTMSAKPLEGQVLGDDSISARTYDGQEVTIDCSVIFRLDTEAVIRVHIDWQDRYTQDLVRPVTRGAVRTLVSQYTVDEVNSFKRKDLERDLDDTLRAIFEDKGLIVDRFVLRNISFTPEYAAAVERKQMALQEVTQRKHEAEQLQALAQGQAGQVRIRADADAYARVIQAEAETKALQLIADALAKNPSLLTYEYINKLSPAIKVMLVPNNAPYILPLSDLAASPVTSPTLPGLTTSLPISVTQPVTLTSTPILTP